jgi:hypothetical protein
MPNERRSAQIHGLAPNDERHPSQAKLSGATHEPHGDQSEIRGGNSPAGNQLMPSDYLFGRDQSRRKKPTTSSAAVAGSQAQALMSLGRSEPQIRMGQETGRPLCTSSRSARHRRTPHGVTRGADLGGAGECRAPFCPIQPRDDVPHFGPMHSRSLSKCSDGSSLSAATVIPLSHMPCSEHVLQQGLEIHRAAAFPYVGGLSEVLLMLGGPRLHDFLVPWLVSNPAIMQALVNVDNLGLLAGAPAPDTSP